MSDVSFVQSRGNAVPQEGEQLNGPEEKKGNIVEKFSDAFSSPVETQTDAKGDIAHTA